MLWISLTLFLNTPQREEALIHFSPRMYLGKTVPFNFNNYRLLKNWMFDGQTRKSEVKPNEI